MRLNLCLLLLVLAFGVVPTFAQRHKQPTSVAQRCMTEQAPKLRGLSLGQTVVQIDQIMPGYEKVYRKDEYGDSGFSRTDWSDFDSHGKNVVTHREVDSVWSSGVFGDDEVEWGNEDPRLVSEFLGDSEGLGKIGLWLSQGKLYGIAMYYSEYEPSSLQSFIKQVAPHLKIPPTGWNIRAGRTEAVLQCRGFKVSVRMNYRDWASITVTDTEAEARVLARVERVRSDRKLRHDEEVKDEKLRRTTIRP